jgi:hypothetical protein
MKFSINALLAFVAAWLFGTTAASAHPVSSVMVSADPTVVVAEIFHVASSRQAALVKRLSNESLLQKLPGFDAAMVLDEPIHENIPGLVLEDGLMRVVRYVRLQWVSKAQVETSLTLLSAAQSQSGDITPIQIFRLPYSAQSDKSGISQFNLSDTGIVVNDVTIFDPATQQQVLQGMIGIDEVAKTNPAWRNSNIHTSTDGLRNFNLVRFSDHAQALSALYALLSGGIPGGTSPLGSLGLTDVHLYTLKWAVGREFRPGLWIPGH